MTVKVVSRDIYAALRSPEGIARPEYLGRIHYIDT
jgi:hypothetical protein